jgi:hypothetical protein
MAFDIEVNQTTDPANNVTMNFCDIPNCEDTSQSGDWSTQHTRLWSSNTRSATWPSCSSSNCVQQDYPGLDAPTVCHPSGNTQNVGISAGTGGATIGWNETFPVNYACTVQTTVSDGYSNYYDYTRTSRDYWDTQTTQDYTSGQYEQNSGYGPHGKQFDVGLFAKSVWWLNFYCCGTPGRFTVSTGNWYDTWNY